MALCPGPGALGKVIRGHSLLHPPRAISRQFVLLVKQSSEYYALLERLPVVWAIIHNLLVRCGGKSVGVRKADDLVLHPLV